ncbi:hypothetical protein P171DRAFT_63770 [Karstenula rhodostoma CBS 690.94]|uniref:Uncharacterized protein n=1 Tax=Karstenula rhodostoma CBS 690.94 TaxID=1392251 RepID=A0A9P4U9P8_9PLEO|nr:hypothetical protein P171DRAFT_63770 [Karstenula rhodostoma CBS 690.94]
MLSIRNHCEMFQRYHTGHHKVRYLEKAERLSSLDVAHGRWRKESQFGGEGSVLTRMAACDCLAEPKKTSRGCLLLAQHEPQPQHERERSRPFLAASATPQPPLHALLGHPHRVRQSQKRLHPSAARLRTRAISLANRPAPRTTKAQPLDVGRPAPNTVHRTFALPAPDPAACIHA